MAGPPPIRDDTGALWQRLAEPSPVLGQDALLQQSAARLVATLLMCDPAYVLTVAERERLTGCTADSGKDAGERGSGDASAP
jgi:hypothetical protein